MGIGGVVSIVAVLALMLLSWRAGTRIPQGTRVPMQWGPGSRPTWTAPRSIALWFTPALAAAALSFVAWLAQGCVASSRENICMLVQAAVALSFVAAHALYLRLAARA